MHTQAHQRNHVGPKYGHSQAMKFEWRIIQLFDAGEKDEGHKTGSDAMAAIIRQENPTIMLQWPTAAQIQVRYMTCCLTEGSKHMSKPRCPEQTEACTFTKP